MAFLCKCQIDRKCEPGMSHSRMLKVTCMQCPPPRRPSRSYLSFTASGSVAPPGSRPPAQVASPSSRTKQSAIGATRLSMAPSRCRLLETCDPAAQWVRCPLRGGRSGPRSPLLGTASAGDAGAAPLSSTRGLLGSWLLGNTVGYSEAEVGLNDREKSSRMRGNRGVTTAPPGGRDLG